MSVKKKLLTDGKSNTKTAKNSMHTYYLSLQPTNLNSMGENLCKFSTKECRQACLQFAGRQSFSNVVQSRTRKTEYFVTRREEFLKELWAELEVLNQKGKCAIRLNLLSDVNWENEFSTIGKNLATLRKIQLYDYTKDPLKIVGSQVKKYNFTFSYSGGNWRWCEKFLKEKTANVAVVFDKKLPSTYKGYKVIDGTLDDERFLDKKGVIVGLVYKTARGQKIDVINSKFIVK